MAARKYIDDFQDETGWTPGESTTFAGALRYLEYDFLAAAPVLLCFDGSGPARRAVAVAGEPRDEIVEAAKEQLTS